MRRINSLMAPLNSLLDRNKFPVPVRRELPCKLLTPLLNYKLITSFGGPDEQNSLYFPS
jgi:hypothetical protein